MATATAGTTSWPVMEFVGAVVGFFVCFIAGTMVLIRLMGVGENYRASRGTPLVRPWLGVANIAIACLGALGGYLLVQVYWM